jgi:hypothetical protein
MTKWGITYIIKSVNPFTGVTTYSNKKIAYYKATTEFEALDQFNLEFASELENIETIDIIEIN